MLPSETMIWQPEFTDKTLSRKPGAVQLVASLLLLSTLDRPLLHTLPTLLLQSLHLRLKQVSSSPCPINKSSVL
ncbi:hypothetical protein, partial [Escherichia coli]|uniref:hypothetical protein n=1 Tax=Escherichia coli TaxID=562 RepID=UPI001BD23DC2